MSIWYFGLAVVVYYLLHSLLADIRVKSWLKDRIVPAPRYRLLYNVLAVVLIIPVVFLYIKSHKTELFQSFFLNEIAGWLLMITGALLTLYALRQYDLAEFAGTYQLKNATDQHPGGLNTSGLNAIVRHPLYLASLLFFGGAFLAHPNDAMLLLAILSTGYLFVGIWLEEKKLVATFGEAYEQYRQQVPMLFPKLKGLKIIVL